MVVGVCTLELDIPSSHSLKDKRRVVRSLTARVRRSFNVSIAEVDSLDAWQNATLGIVCVSGDRDYAQGLLQKVIDAIERMRMDAVIADYSLEYW
ncbi:MAG: DUF503 domain-containing protein [Chloroflexi bacterium]|nr:DUF503 domain-containing protein [Chloroflexota bacterium]